VAAQDRSDSSIRFDLFELDPQNCQLRRSGTIVDIPRQAVKVLSLLAARPGEVISRQEIQQALWPGQSHGDFDSRLNFAVKKLREGLGDSAEQPRYVQTVRNAGYVFVAPVRPTGGISSFDSEIAAGRDLSSDPAMKSASAAADPVLAQIVAQKTRRPFRVLLPGAVAIIALVVISGRLILPSQETRGNNSPRPEERDPRTVDGMPIISSVSSILPRPTQKIVIRGRGFGLHVRYSDTDSPYLALRDETADWAAGRIIPQNWDEVKLDVSSWTDDEIVISGFSGDYGQKNWRLSAGDQVMVSVWNPQSRLGPSTYRVRVEAASRP
jgi:DNA-binding winged helix-turn-helix (wHTH) protein